MVVARHELEKHADGDRPAPTLAAVPPARDDALAPRWRSLLRSRESVLGPGLAWLMIGMLVMPAGVSFNPGKLYQTSLIVLLYLPALWLALRGRAAVCRALWPLPAFRVFLLLLAWAVASLGWAHLRHAGDELGRMLSVLVFVLACQAWCGRAPWRGAALLAMVGWGMALCALAFSAVFLLLPHADGERIVGAGVIATANYAAAAMGAACVWLAQLRWRSRWGVAACMGSLAALLLFVALTDSRSVWLALAVCALLSPLWLPGRLPKAVAAVVLLLMLAVAIWPLPALTERGASLRPEIFGHALRMIARHPWLGLGQGAPFVIEVGGQHLTHSHNVLTQTAIELGLPGLALAAALWALVAWSGWRHRAETLGRVVLALWVYASVVLQFDLPQLLDSPRPGWLLIWLPFALALGLEARSRAALPGPLA